MNNDVILLFGGDGKIAHAIVQKYLDNNSIVIAIDKNEKSRNDEFYNNSNYHYYCTDITNIEQLLTLRNELQKKFPHIDHIISAAGAPRPIEEKGFSALTFEDIDESIKLNLSAHLYITKVFLPLLQESASKNKSITLVASINALKDFGLPAYSAAKSGIYGFMNSMVGDLGKQHIRINTISPGTVASHEEVAAKEAFWGYAYKDMMALNRFTYPEDIADGMFALTHITKAITGQNIVVDSGQII